MNSRWRTLLLRIGDRCPEYGGSNDFKEHIETCYGVLWRDFKNSKNEIIESILQCTEQLPHKIPFYGVLIGLINLEDEDFVKEIVDNSHSNLQDALQHGSCNSIRILFRFIAVLMCSKVLLPGSVVEAFETLLSSAAMTIDEESGNPSWQPCADFYVSCILSSLPWCGLELFEQAPDDLDRIMVGIQSYLSIRKHTSDHVCAVFMLNESKYLEKKDFLEDLWDRIQILSNGGWKAESVPKPHLSFEVQLIDGRSHDFPPIICPEQPHKVSTNSAISILKMKHEAELKFPRRLHRLHIFPADKVEKMQPIDRYVVEEYLLDVLFFFNGCRKECALYMVGLPVPFRYEYLMAETIFSQLLLLPQPPFRPFYYSLVIIDLCKSLPGAFPAVIAGAVRALFDRIDELDMECRFRLILWFTHHISNFQFIWLWDEWAHVIDLPKWAPQRVFVQEVLEREVRLSYWDKIKKSIENAPLLDELMPPKVGSCFKFGTDDGNERAEGHDLSAELSSMVKGRKTAREITSWVEKSIITLHGLDFALVVVTQTLLNIGSKSFTHLTTVLERYGQVIGKLCSDHEKQGLLIQEVSSYWKNNTQMTAVTIDRMMGYRLVSSLAIVDWVFSSANVDQFHLKDLAWEVLRNAINKTTNLISDMRKEILSLEKAIITAEESEIKSRAELEDAESKLMVVNGEPVQGENPGRLKRLKTYLEKAKSDVTSLRESLEAKEALLARAVDENKALFLSLYRKFSGVLSQRLSDAETMTVDSEGPASMETDQDNDNPIESQGNDERKTVKYNIGEREQWGRSTLGYVKAFSRQYATQILPHMDLLDAEIFVGDVHPLFLKAVYAGLGRAASPN